MDNTEAMELIRKGGEATEREKAIQFIADEYEKLQALKPLPTLEEIGRIIRGCCTSRSGASVRREDIFLLCDEIATAILDLLKGVK